jgi:hypothetical protein
MLSRPDPRRKVKLISFAAASRTVAEIVDLKLQPASLPCRTKSISGTVNGAQFPFPGRRLTIHLQQIPLW